jgi:glucose-1-phosphate thymidylyltransferase
MKNKIKGIILAGGMGTRLYPLTKVTNKHLLPIGGEPMIFYPLRKLTEAGIKDVMVVTGVEHCGGIMSLLGSGKDHDCSITYKVQDQPDGIAGALKLCKNFVGDSPCVVLLGDNIFNEDITSHIKDFELSDDDCKLFFKRITDPRRYGVGAFKDKKLIEIEEKPEIPKSNMACVGIYMYSNKVFDVLSGAKKSDRGEYEITQINNVFVKNHKVSYVIMKDLWVDAGTMDSYHKTNWLIYKQGI